eukprot:5934189-Alexandrium_andersonii.AAC.3
MQMSKPRQTEEPCFPEAWNQQRPETLKCRSGPSGALRSASGNCSSAASGPVLSTCTRKSRSCPGRAIVGWSSWLVVLLDRLAYHEFGLSCCWIGLRTTSGCLAQSRGSKVTILEGAALTSSMSSPRTPPRPFPHQVLRSQRVATPPAVFLAGRPTCRNRVLVAQKL